MKVKEQPIEEIKRLRQEVAKLRQEKTERKQAEEKLRESEERFRSVVEYSHEGILIVDDAYHLTYGNDELCRILGYFHEEIIGQDFRKFLDEESKLLVADQYVRRQRGEKIPPQYEFNIVRKNGEKRHVAISSTVIKDLAGKVMTVAQILDITEEKQAEEALQASEERYRNLFENATDGIFTMDLKTRFTSGNKRAEVMCGYNKEELIGQYATVILPEEEIPRIADVFKRVLKGEINTYETNIFTKNGDLIPVEVTSSPIEVDGKIVGAMGMARDITERKRWEEMLQRSEKKYRTIIENITEGYYEVDLAGNFTFVNDSLCKILGYPKNEMMGMNDRQYTDKENAKKVFQAFRKVYTTGKPATGFDWEFTRKDGTKIIVEASISVIRNPEGEAIGFRNVLRDVTERKQAEKALQEAKTRFEDLFETANELIITTDAEGWILRLNKEVEKLSGYSKRN